MRQTVAWLAGELVWRSETGTVPLGLHRLPFMRRRLRHLFHLSLVNDEELYVPYLMAAFYRHYEPRTVAMVAELLEPGQVFVDVGANIGLFTLIASRAVGPAGRVHAVEPVAHTRAILGWNIRRHRLANVTVHPYAAGTEARTRSFWSTDDTGNDGFAIGPYSANPVEIRVEERRLDALIDGRVDVVKMDVQGSELDALRGMDRIFERNHAITALVEWGPAWMKAAGSDPMDLPRFFLDRGFQELVAIDDDSGTVVSIEAMTETFAQQPKHYCNILARRA